MRKALLLSISALAFVTGCKDPGGITFDRDGAVGGLAFVDRDGNGVLTAADVPASGVSVALLLDATGDTVAKATSVGNGTFMMGGIAAGRYRLVASRGTAGDTIDVLEVDSAQITLAARDTAARLVRLGYPRVGVGSVKLLTAGRRITLEGIALNPWAAFGDSTIHIYDATGALRAVRVQQIPIQGGDSISLVGTTGVLNGRVVLADVTGRIVTAARGLPPADSLSTLRAASADQNRLTDAQVRIGGALIRDTITVGNYRRVGVDDGSGRLEVMLNRNTAFPVEAFSPGATVSITGLLVPAAAGTAWQLKPRVPTDVTATFPLVTAAQARTVPSGSRVYIDGIALNGWAVFADSTVHLADATGAIRAVRLPPSGVQTGDSVQILGTTGVADGRLALLDASVRLVAAGRGLPALNLVTTAVAASAAGDSRADGQVRISGAVIRDTATIAGDFVLGVDDGSGRLEVVLDRNITFNPGPYVPGGTFSGAGVLVPTPTSTAWRLKPRERNEAVISFPTMSIAVARTVAQGQGVVLQGRALNSWSAFGDSTVHIIDATGSMRTVRVVGNVAAGDSIRLVGTKTTVDGQPVLTGVTATVLVAGIGLPNPDSISTARAATADGGTRDGGQVRAGGTITGAQTLPNGDRLVTLDDGSGSLGVVFDKDPFPSLAYSPGGLLNVAGVLVPSGGGWRLKPRALQDVSATFPEVTVAQARALAPGNVVFIRGTALNSWNAFGDASVHIKDNSGSIRVLNLPFSQIVTGYSVRILGTISAQNGQPVINGAAAEVLLVGNDPGTPDSVSTKDADIAAGGRDAAQVAVSGLVSAAVIDPAGSGDLLLTISDGSGPLTVRLDKDVGFAFGTYQTGNQLRVRGVLVATALGTWELKPRVPADVVKN